MNCFFITLRSVVLWALAIIALEIKSCQSKAPSCSRRRTLPGARQHASSNSKLTGSTDRDDAAVTRMQANEDGGDHVITLYGSATGTGTSTI